MDKQCVFVGAQIEKYTLKQFVRNPNVTAVLHLLEVQETKTI